MKSVQVFPIVLAVLGASANPRADNFFQPISFKIIKGDCGSSVPSLKSHIRTSVTENPTFNVPSFLPPATISQPCHCLRTILRPQILNEVVSVPADDKTLRAVANPIVAPVESVSPRTFNQKTVFSKGSRYRHLGRVFQNIPTLGGSNNGLFGEGIASFSNSHSHTSNSANAGSLNKWNRVGGNVISQPSASTFQNVNGKNYLGSTNPQAQEMRIS